jgi:beta-lactamase regulating signal transducer with metallopeptidase domain
MLTHLFPELFPDQAIAWLLTYLLHSTLLLGLAWLVSKPLGRWSAAAEDAVWKVALVGALLTASLQLAAGWEPAAGRWSLPGAPEGVTVAADLAVPVRGAAPALLDNPRPAAMVPAPAAETSTLQAPSATALALGLWTLVGCLLLAAYGRSHLRLRGRLRNRPRVVGGTLLARLRRLSAEAGMGRAVRLSCSSRVPVPVALGLARREICVPPRAFAGLSDEQQEGMLAHELAHLVRRDPLWLVVSHLVACAFFFQPLNWVARRRLREISEMLSDEWAVGRTGRPLSLAGCLAEVAGWSAAGRELPVPVMADRPSHLGRRIRRLLDESRSPESPARRVWMGAAMVVLLIAVVAAAPAVSSARPAASSPPAAPAAQAAPAAPAAAAMAQPSAAEEPEDHEVAEEQAVETHAAVKLDGERDADPDLDNDYDLDYDLDLDLDLNLDLDAGEIAEQAADAATAALDGLDGQLAQLSERRSLSEEDQEKLEREIERTNKEIENKLKPRMEQLSRELSEKLSREIPTPQMRKLEEQMGTLAEQMRPSAEEMARLHAQIDAEMKKLHAEGELSREEREKIAAEARRLAQEMRKMKPSPEQRKAMEELRRQHQELSRQFMTEHREEIDKATREMREEIRQEMDAVRAEVRRSMEQQRKLLQEERREKHRLREKMPQDREHRRDDGDAKPPGD